MVSAADLTRSDLARAFAFVRELSAEREPGQLVRRVVVGLPELVASELTTLSVCDLQAETRHVVSYPDDAISREDLDAFDRHIAEHPLVRFHSEHPRGGARKVSDFLPLPAFRDLGIYQEYYQSIGIDHVMAVPLIASRNLVVSFVLNRVRRDFGERERQMLDVVRPILANLYQGAIAMQRAAATLACVRVLAPRAECYVLMMDSGGHIAGASEDALAILAAVFPDSSMHIGARLPEPLDDWCDAQRVALLEGSGCDAPSRLNIESGGRAVNIALLAGVERGEYVLLIGETGSVEPRLPTSLTPRERQVLTWVAAGKTNADVARILGTSDRTVQKHLERIYVKLGVESRTAAVGRAFLREGWCPPAD